MPMPGPTPRHNPRPIFGLAVTLAILWVSAGCSQRPAPEPLMIGQLVPLSGSSKFAGEQAQHGADLAVEEAAKDPAVLAGRLLIVEHKDTQSTPEAVVPAAITLLRINRVTALISTLDAAQNDRLAQSLQLVNPGPEPSSQRTLLVGPAEAAVLPDNTFALEPSAGRHGQLLGRFMTQGLNLFRVAVLTDTRSGYAASASAGFVEEFIKGHATRPDEWGYASDTDMIEMAERVERSKPDGLLVSGAARDFARLRGRFEKAGLAFKAIMYAGDSTQLSELTGDRGGSKGVIVATCYCDGQFPAKGEKFVRSFRERYRLSPDIHAAVAYDAVRLLTDAARTVLTQPPGDPAKLREYFAGPPAPTATPAPASPPATATAPARPDPLRFESVTGELTFGRDHYARRPMFVVRLGDGSQKLEKRYDPDP